MGMPPSTAWQLSEIVSLPLRNAFRVDWERRTSFSVIGTVFRF